MAKMATILAQIAQGNANIDRMAEPIMVLTRRPIIGDDFKDEKGSVSPGETLLAKS